MTLFKAAFRGGMWLAMFTATSQVFSWGTTLIVARLLSPGDYGLLAMAALLTGYIHVFYEMGIGAAIVQRPKISQDELSSIFWLLLLWGFVLAGACFVVAYPTVIIFSEPRIFHITQSMSVLFLLNTVGLVPVALLKREMRFKAIGAINATAVIISCVFMVAIALLGAGVWTLVAGMFISTAIQVGLSFISCRWMPSIQCSKSDAAPFLRFGVPLVGAVSCRYLYSRAGTFFGGRAFSASGLGYYSLAFQLASIPNDKVLNVINSVTFPTFSRIQEDPQEVRRFFLLISQFLALILLPAYAGGCFLAEDLITWLLGDQWHASVAPFQILCVAFASSTVLSPCQVVNMAQGRTGWHFRFHFLCSFPMIVGFYLAARYGTPTHLAIPQLAIVAPASFIYSWVTMKELGISMRDLFSHLSFPILTSGSMLLMLYLFRYVARTASTPCSLTHGYYVVPAVLIGVAWYSGCVLIFQRPLVGRLFRVLKERT